MNGRTKVAIWGAGRVGKDFARSLLDAGVEVDVFYDIDPRKIGQQIYAARVHDARKLADGLRGHLLIAVGSPGARELIRDELKGSGLREPWDFTCVA